MLSEGQAFTPERLEALFRPLSNEDRIGLAVSGGADSLGLMLLARAWAEDTGKQLFVYTVDHGLRPEAAAECAFVAETATGLGLEARVLAWQGPKPETGVQAAARVARYRLIGQAMRADGVEMLVTAHHLEDQAETVLMRLAHGSGLGGLGGMRQMAEIEGVKVCRPLLGIAKAALAEVVHEARLTPVTDPSNADESFERVRWRRVLEAVAAEGLDARRLSEFARRARRADHALELTMQTMWNELVDRSPLGVVRLSRLPFDVLSEEIVVRMLRRILAWAGAQSRPFALGLVEDLLKRLRRGSKDVQTLSGCLIQPDDAAITILREPARVEAEEVQLQPGQSLVFDRRFRITNEGGQTVQVMPGRDMTRSQIEAWLGAPLTDPMAAVHAAPLVRDAEGAILSVGRTVRGPDVAVAFTKWDETAP